MFILVVILLKGSLLHCDLYSFIGFILAFLMGSTYILFTPQTMERRQVIFTIQLFLIGVWIAYEESLRGGSFTSVIGAFWGASLIAPLIGSSFFYLITLLINKFRETKIAFSWTNVTFWYVQYMFALQLFTFLNFILTGGYSNFTG